MSFTSSSVVVLGRVGTEPIARQTVNENEWVRFSVDVDSYERVSEGQAYRIPIVAWNEKAKICKEILKKGTLVQIIGTLRTDNREGRNFVEIIASRIIAVANRKEKEDNTDSVPDETYLW